MQKQVSKYNDRGLKLKADATLSTANKYCK